MALRVVSMLRRCHFHVDQVDRELERLARVESGCQNRELELFRVEPRDLELVASVPERTTGDYVRTESVHRSMREVLSQSVQHHNSGVPDGAYAPVSVVQNVSGQ